MDDVIEMLKIKTTITTIKISSEDDLLEVHEMLRKPTALLYIL